MAKRLLNSIPPPAPSSARVIAPCWQTDANSYTFLTVSHASLVNMNSEIGVSLTAVENNDGPFGPTEEFTLRSGETRKVFIVTTNNAGINPVNLSNAGLIIGNAGGGKGQLIFNPIASAPQTMVGNASSSGRGFPDITSLSFWGAVIIASTSTGFAMEFFGDEQDSRIFNLPRSSGLN